MGSLGPVAVTVFDYVLRSQSLADSLATSFATGFATGFEELKRLGLTVSSRQLRL